MEKQKKKTLVIGASDNPERYSYLAIHRLKNNGHPVVAIGRKPVTVAGVQADIEMKPYDNIDTVTLYINPTHQKDYYNYIFSLSPRRIIFNPGTENEELEMLAKQHGIEPMEACTLTLLATGQY